MYESLLTICILIRGSLLRPYFYDVPFYATTTPLLLTIDPSVSLCLKPSCEKG